MNTSVKPSTESPPKVAPTLQLSRRGLVISLASMAIPGRVTLDRQVVETKAGGGGTLTNVVVLENLSEAEIPRLSIEVNGQYLLHRDSPLGQAEPLVLPLQVFTDKRSSQRYNFVKYPPKEVIVTGQLPSGARGISKFEFE
jgi:hypothetical protein